MDVWKASIANGPIITTGKQTIAYLWWAILDDPLSAVVVVVVIVKALHQLC